MTGKEKKLYLEDRELISSKQPSYLHNCKILLLFLWFWGHPSSAQELFLTLCSGMTPRGAQWPYVVSQIWSIIGTKAATCEASVFFPVLSLAPRRVCVVVDEEHGRRDEFQTGLLNNKQWVLWAALLWQLYLQKLNKLRTIHREWACLGRQIIFHVIHLIVRLARVKFVTIMSHWGLHNGMMRFC